MASQPVMNLGIDIGSTTVKVVLRDGDKIIYSNYRRHFSKVRHTAADMLQEVKETVAPGKVRVALSGSGGLGLANDFGLSFVQEVFATGEIISKFAPDTGVVIELGGEDAKVIFFDGGIDERMNGSCAGGTGAFIDQMAVLLNMTVDEMDAESLKAERIYPIASRCGVFAKSDIQPLLNQGASKADVAAGIFQAVVNQTVSGLVQGRKITGKVMFLGGPLYFCKGLRKRFVETLKLSEDRAVFPEYALLSVAAGASMYAEKTEERDFNELISLFLQGADKDADSGDRLPPLFESSEEYDSFTERHKRSAVPLSDIKSYSGNAWLGADCGSTTTKLALIAEDDSILYSYYGPNQGNPVDLIRRELIKIRELCGDRIKICGSAVTGYGEELNKNAFRFDCGIVETVAHYTAARHFRPDVDFILDIGGQDIKCFRIKNGAIDSIMLNEACSSGCGSFIETFAKAMGYSVEDFAKKGIFASAPVNLGSRCTVFMNSSVKQAQKDGATVEDISAGLSVSVVKNAVYKVIRAVSADELGKSIVVQGGTFYNDAVLRAFEREVGAEVIRPSVAGLMGAYGAALRVKKMKESSLLTLDELNNFVHNSKAASCHGCANNCRLTVNTFGDGKKFISGNQCSKGAGKDSSADLPNIFEWKRNRLKALPQGEGEITVGIPLTLSSYELAPLWHGIFTSLGFRVIFSEPSTRRTYEKGQFTIPSDTACYPAKIMHGHMLELMEKTENIFYPGLTYNINERLGDNHYNCPVVAYYGELLNGNMEELKNVNFMHPFLNLESVNHLAKTLLPTVNALNGSIDLATLRKAVKQGFAAYEKYKKDLALEGERIIKEARERNARIMILAGRPYHTDPEICHGIDKLAVSLGFAVVSEDSVCHLTGYRSVGVLDQWTFHSRLYRSAHFAVENKDVELVQLVSFGCGVDAVTTDEVREILEKGGKHYTQLKIDEITNNGAVKIRLRSLLGALEEENE